jgi:hypothetical protein
MSAWQLTGVWRDGLVGTLDVTATRKCGRVEHFTVYRFPAGWRVSVTDRVPKSVLSAALRYARSTRL